MNRKNFYKGYHRYRRLVYNSNDESPEMQWGKHRQFFQKIHLASSHLSDPRSHLLRHLVMKLKNLRALEARQKEEMKRLLQWEHNGVHVSVLGSDLNERWKNPLSKSGFFDRLQERRDNKPGTFRPLEPGEF